MDSVVEAALIIGVCAVVGALMFAGRTAPRRHGDGFTSEELTAAAIDEVGLAIGAVPANTAHLGEQLWITATLPATPHGGRVHAHIDWGTAIWFGPDGLDTHRDLSHLGQGTVGLTLPDPLEEARKVWLAFNVTAHHDRVQLTPAGHETWYYGQMPVRVQGTAGDTGQCAGTQ